MLGVTAFITTDITPVPLLWVIPLSLYLFSFVVVFSRGRRAPDLVHKVMVVAMPVVVTFLVLTILADIWSPYWLLILLHLFGFFVVAMVLHGELARDRPPARHLTEFYLWVAVGGVLGGVFNALVAPIAFNTVAEYPLAIVLACLLLPGTVLKQLLTRRRGNQERGREEEEYVSRQHTADRLLEPRLLLDLALPVVLGVVFWALLRSAELIGLNAEETESWRSLVIGLAAGLCLYFAYSSKRSIRFGLTVAVLVVAVTLHAGTAEGVLYEDRSFFGVYRVSDEGESGYNKLFHGSTNHGAQLLGEMPPTPIAYHDRTGPVGQLFDALPDENATSQVAVLGLGAGVMACHAKPGEQWTFYEIDPLVESIARDPNLFTYLRDCPGESEVILGDARLSLREAPDGEYGVIVSDVFSSDAIPVHLMTREAIELYFQKLDSDGVLAMHISNRHLKLEPVLGDLSQDKGLACYAQFDENTENVPYKFGSRWAVMARDASDLGSLPDDPRWTPCVTSPDGAYVWTDDFSNLLSTLDWN
jgi:spermidine synthase